MIVAVLKKIIKIIKKKEREKERKKRLSVHFFFRGRDFFFFFQIVFAARPWKLAPAQVMVDRCAFVKMLLKSRADLTAKKYLVEIRRFLPGAGRTLLLTVIPFPLL